MYSFHGHLGHPEGWFKDKTGTLQHVMEKRLSRLRRWYAYIKRNRKLGEALSILFGALELAIVEAIRFASKIIPSIDARFMRLIDGKWGSKIVPLNVEIEGVSSGIMPSQQILEIARRVPIRSLNWCYCYRRHAQESNLEQKDRYSCLALGWGQNLSAIDALQRQDPNKKISKNLTISEIEAKLKEWNEQGYIHQLIFFPSPDYFYIICACHPDYCLTLSNTKKWGYPGVVKSDFIATKDDARCRNCGTCISRCHFNAFFRVEDGTIKHNVHNCVGCGLCVTTCNTKAIKLVKRESTK